MNYTIEIEEAERTLEFTLEVECNYQYDNGNCFGPWEDCYPPESSFDIISVDIELVTVYDEDGIPHIIENDFIIFYLIDEAYKSKIENMLDEDDKLFEAWQKHVESV